MAGFDGVELHYAHAYTMASFSIGTTIHARTVMGAARKTEIKPPIGGISGGAQASRRQIIQVRL